MYFLQDSYISLCKAFITAENLLKKYDKNRMWRYKDKSDFESETEMKIYYTGVLNLVWQSWNKFWREYWLATLFQGRGINNLKLPKILPCNTENQTINDILAKLNPKKYVVGGSIRGSYEEPTWGDMRTIQRIAMNFNKVNQPGYKVISAISAFGFPAEHMQIVRNSSVHLCKESIGQSKSILKYYKTRKINHPCEIVMAEELKTSKKAFDYWKDDMITLCGIVIE